VQAALPAAIRLPSFLRERKRARGEKGEREIKYGIMVIEYGIEVILVQKK
jgi:hypothetical protein